MRRLVKSKSPHLSPGVSDVFGPLPATRGTAQAKQRREKESHGRQREAGIARLFLNAPAMSGTAWEARLFLSDMERAGGGGRGRAMCAPPHSFSFLSFHPHPPQLSHMGRGEVEVRRGVERVTWLAAEELVVRKTFRRVDGVIPTQPNPAANKVSLTLQGV